MRIKEETAKLTSMPLDKLYCYPCTDLVNPECSEGENAALEADIAVNGQREPIHVMPPNNRAGILPFAILDGGRRCIALTNIGHTRGKVLIRHDLRNADEATVAKIFLGFNRNRSHLDMLALANNLMRDIGGNCNVHYDERNYKELVARLHLIRPNMSLRNIQRYARAARTPVLVQTALREGRMTLVNAARISYLPEKVQTVLAEKLLFVYDNKETNQIAQSYLQCNTRRPKRYTPIAVRLAKHLTEALVSLDGKFDKIFGPELAPYLPTLLKTQKVLPKLITAARRRRGSLKNIFKEC